MKHKKNSFIVYILLMHFCSLFSHWSDVSWDNALPASHVEIKSDNIPEVHRSNLVLLEVGVTKSNSRSYDLPAHLMLDRYGSPQLQQYFYTQIVPIICGATIKDHCVAIPGYIVPHGLRDLFIDAALFSLTDKASIQALNQRLEVYYSAIEQIVYNKKEGLWNLSLLFDSQVQLAKIYIQFLKEFYPSLIWPILQETTSNTSVMQRVKQLHWHKFENITSCNSKKQVAQGDASALNGKLGAAYSAFKKDNIEQAYKLGHERVTVKNPGWRGWFEDKVTTTSVFEHYSDLREKIEQEYSAYKAKMEQEIFANQKENALVAEQSNDVNAHENIDEAIAQEVVHALQEPTALCISPENLTADQKGILLYGIPLQHALIDDSIDVVDEVIDQRLSGELRDAVIDLANVSITTNKNGDIPKTFMVLDTCWKILDFTEKAARCAHSTLTEKLPIVAAMVEGVAESVQSTAHLIRYPVQAAQDAASAFMAAGYSLGRLTYAVALHSTACEDIIETDPLRAEEILKAHGPDPAIMDALCAEIKNTSATDVARFGTKTITDFMLLHGIQKAVSAIGAKAMPVLLRCMNKGARSAEIAVSAEGIPLGCAEEVNALMNNVQKAEGTAQVAGTALEVAKNAPELLRTFNIAHYDSSIGNLQKLEQAIERLKNIPGALTKDGPLFKALEFGKKMEMLPEPLTITQFNSRLTTARGAMYEVEKALELLEAGENITNLGLKISGINAKKEFDIITSTKLIECKNIDWLGKTKKDLIDMVGKLCDQKKVALENGKIFEVHSKRMIPSEIKTWLSEKGIIFFEDIL
jgi:hypothetical protein